TPTTTPTAPISVLANPTTISAQIPSSTMPTSGQTNVRRCWGASRTGGAITAGRVTGAGRVGDRSAPGPEGPNDGPRGSVIGRALDRFAASGSWSARSRSPGGAFGDQRVGDRDSEASGAQVATAEARVGVV